MPSTTARTGRARSRIAGWLLAAVLPAAVPTALAAPEAAPLTLGKAVERALASSPALAGFAYALRAEDARIEQAAQAPAPEAALEVENVLGSGAYSGADAAEITLALSQVIELGGKRDLRAAAARSGRELVTVEQQAAQLDVLAEVSRRFIAVAAAEERRRLADEGTALAQATVDDVARRVRAAKSPEAELLRARTALARADLAGRQAESRLSAARQALAATWGASQPDFGAVQADLYALPALEDFAALAARLDASPDFLRFTSEARLREAEGRLAASQRRPDLELSAGVRRFAEDDDNAFVLGVAVPLAGGRRSAPAVTESTALRARAGADQAAARMEARTRLHALYTELQQAGREASVLRTEILPGLEKALDATRYAYERGRYGYLELVDARREFLEARGALIDAAVTARELLIDIERLTGEPLAAAPAAPELENQKP
jgi:cobalt-zinc-cadmium efflux system outer membrane protein